MDNVTLHTTRNLKTTWGIEKHGSEVFTHEVFSDFQKEVIAARDHCLIDSVQQEGDVKITGIIEGSRRPRVVQYSLRPRLNGRLEFKIFPNLIDHMSPVLTSQTELQYLFTSASAWEHSWPQVFFSR